MSEKNLFDTPCGDDGFNRYMAVDPNGEAFWESEFAAGISESEAWGYFIDWCDLGEHCGVDDFDRARSEVNEGELYEDKMREYGWRMVECHPVACESERIVNAAPALLAACKAIRDWRVSGGTGIGDSIWDQLIAAIKKAEGDK